MINGDPLKLEWTGCGTGDMQRMAPWTLSDWLDWSGLECRLYSPVFGL